MYQVLQFQDISISFLTCLRSTFQARGECFMGSRELYKVTDNNDKTQT